MPIDGVRLGDVVWALPKRWGSIKDGGPWFPAVVTSIDDRSTLTVRFTDENGDLDKNEFPLPGEHLKVFDASKAAALGPPSVQKTPDSTGAQAYMRKVHAARRIQEARMAVDRKEYDEKIKELTQGCQDVQGLHRASVARVDLAAGARLFYWIPGMIAGRPEAAAYARVLTVYDAERIDETKIPVELDAGHILTLDTEVKMLEPTPSESMVRLEQFNLVPSSVDGVRSSDVIVESVRQHCTLLKESNPAYAGLINDPFASRLPAQSPPAVHPPRPKKSSQGRPSSPQAASLASRPTLPTPPTRGITRPVVSDSDESDGDHHYRVPAKKSNGASNGATQVKRAPAARKRGRDEAPEPRRRPRKPTPTSSKGTRAKARKAKGQTEITQFCYPKLPLHQSAPSSDDNSSGAPSPVLAPSPVPAPRQLPSVKSGNEFSLALDDDLGDILEQCK
ncbi:Tudor domain-containing protein [Plasmodiophora brassicae]|nr:hypothetical protein PBRA_002882 [Plasmodiophora brassicae]